MGGGYLLYGGGRYYLDNSYRGGQFYLDNNDRGVRFIVWGGGTFYMEGVDII